VCVCMWCMWRESECVYVVYVERVSVCMCVYEVYVERESRE